MDHSFYSIVPLAKNILTSGISSIYHQTEKGAISLPKRKRGRIEQGSSCARSYRVGKILLHVKGFFPHDPSGFKLQMPYQLYANPVKLGF